MLFGVWVSRDRVPAGCQADRARSRWLRALSGAWCGGLVRVVGQGLVQEMLPGAALVLPLTKKPKLVEAFAPREPLYAALRTLTVPVVPVLMPFQTLPRVCPPASVRCTVQPLRVVEPLLATVISPWNPPSQWLTMRNVPVQAPGCPVLVGVVDGVLDGVFDGVLTRVV